MGLAAQRLSLYPSLMLEHVERLHALLCVSGGTVAACGGGGGGGGGVETAAVSREPASKAVAGPREQRQEARPRRLFSSCFCLLQLGLRSLVPLLRLVLFTLMLLPVFIRLTYQYFTLSRLQRGLRYGPHSRNLLDLYLPAQDECKQSRRSAKKKPIVIFFSGGAWVIGNKAWGFAIGKTLSRNDIIVVAPDYRNFPDGNLSDMLSDCHAAIAWTFANADIIGGDVSDITLLGQSAGAHISSLCLLRQAQHEHRLGHHKHRTPDELRWRASSVRRFVGVSGPYDLEQLFEHLHRFGAYRSVLHRLTDFQLGRCSPTNIIDDTSQDAAWMLLLPPHELLHGDLDDSVPHSFSEQYLQVLQRRGVEATLTTLIGRSHTDPILEDHMRGEDKLMEHMVAIITGKRDGLALQRLWPDALLRLSKKVNPF